MPRNEERIQRTAEALRGAGVDVLVCALPMNVLMLSGYWPVTGRALAVVTREGRIVIVAPEDERDLAEKGWADEVRTFAPASLKQLNDPMEELRTEVVQVWKEIGPKKGRVGYEHGPTSQPAPYAAMIVYGTSLRDLLDASLSPASLTPADSLLEQLRAGKTPCEVERIRAACEVAGASFAAASPIAGNSEAEIAAAMQGELLRNGMHGDDMVRCGGFAFCMSGPNAADAYRAYARTGTRSISAGDLVLLHCNSTIDGYWTDITRTFHVGDPDERTERMYEAIFAARRAALDAIRPGIKGCEVDRAARGVLQEYGFDEEFKHPTGHGVGFAAIDHGALPRLHPTSEDTLKIGMVFNVEPAIYIEGYGGLRHCDMVAVTQTGAEVLTPFLASAEELIRSA